MKTHRYNVLPPLCGIVLAWSSFARADILVTGTEVKKLSADTTISYVHLRINKERGDGHEATGTEVTLSNLVKPFDDKPTIWINPAKTIVGYTAGYVRRNYQINLIWCAASGRCFIDQYLNNRLMNLLTDNKVKQAEGELDPILFYLDGLKEDILSIGYRSDAASGSFHFRVRVTGNGELKLVPRSVQTDE